MVDQFSRRTDCAFCEGSIHRPAARKSPRVPFPMPPVAPPPFSASQMAVEGSSLHQQPQMMCTLSMPRASLPQIPLHSLIDSGADVSVISFSAWPPEWPLALVRPAIVGLGDTIQIFVSPWSVLVRNSEGQTAAVQPWVTAVLFNLWGQDVLEA